jgi:cytochrome P450 PksS
MQEEFSVSDLFAQETERNPCAFYARLRAQGPLHHFADFVGVGPGWLATTYADAAAILKDPRFIKDRRKVVLPSHRPEDDGPESGRAVAAESVHPHMPLSWRRDMLTMDAPDHTRLRNLVSKAFTPRMIEQLRPRVQQITDELLDAVASQGRMDLIDDFAFPLPMTVICELLGIPVTERQRFRAWTQAIVDGVLEPGQEAAAAAAEVAFIDYIKALLDEKRAHPGSDLTSGLVHAEEQGDTLSEEELISMIWLLIVAGHVTTVNLIGAGTLTLLEHPDRLRQLQQDPSVLPATIEELLRYTSPVGFASPRWASEDVLLHGQMIRQGEMVIASLVAANTDPAQFHDPELLDLTRAENAHLAFGKGIHYCLGAPLARLEGQIAIGTVLRRVPQLRLAVDPAQLVWNHTGALRGPESLPVAL